MNIETFAKLDPNDNEVRRKTRNPKETRVMYILGVCANLLLFLLMMLLPPFLERFAQHHHNQRINRIYEGLPMSQGRFNKFVQLSTEKYVNAANVFTGFFIIYLLAMGFIVFPLKIHTIDNGPLKDSGRLARLDPSNAVLAILVIFTSVFGLLASLALTWIFRDDRSRWLFLAILIFYIAIIAFVVKYMGKTFPA